MEAISSNLPAYGTDAVTFTTDEARPEIFAARAMRHASAHRMDDEGWWAESSSAPGAWGAGETADEALDDLRSTLVSWADVVLRLGHRLPVVDGLDLN